MKARAVEFAAPRRVEIREVEVREPNEAEVLVRTVSSGISGGTELLAYRGEIDPDLPLDESLGSLGGTFAFPFRYGYSIVGRAEQGAHGVGDGATVFAFHPHQDLATVPARDVIDIGHVAPRIATLFPIVETALQISLDAGQVEGETVAVLGQGPIGIVSALLLTRAGANALAAEPRPLRRRIAGELGLHTCAPDELADAVADATDGKGASLVVEASGAPGALADALPLVRHEGTVLVASWYGSKPVELPLGRDFHRRRLSIRSTQVSTIPARLRDEWTLERRREVARTLLEELPLAPLATHEVPFDDAAEAYAMIDRGDDGVMHVALRYDR